MKKFIIAVLVVCMLFMCACNDNPKDSSSASASDSQGEKVDSILSDTKWYYYDKNAEENINITFTDNGEFYYVYDGGKPEEDSDLYGFYSYDANKKLITVSGEKGKMELPVIYLDGNYITIKFEKYGYTRTFINKAFTEEELVNKAVLKEYDGEFILQATFLAFENGKMTVAPFDYDADSKKLFIEKIFDIPVAEDANFYDVSVIVENDKPQTTKAVIDRKEIENNEDFSSAGFVDFNKEGQIQSVVFYGETIIW